MQGGYNVRSKYRKLTEQKGLSNRPWRGACDSGDDIWDSVYVFPSVFFASLALTLAILSKGRDSRLGHRAKIGAITGTVSFSLLALIAVIVTVFFVSNPDMWNDFKSLYQEQYNRILEEFEDMSEEDYQQKGKQLW